MLSKKIAITGGIGSGKSSVSKVLRDKGYSVISADAIYAELFDCGTFDQDLRKAFGSQILQDGKIERKKLAAVVFSDKEKTELLNSITHPQIMEEMKRRMTDSFSFAEIPLLFEDKLELFFDSIWVVSRSKEDRIQAVMKRSGLSYREVLIRMSRQIDYDTFPLSQYTIIENNGSIAELCEKVLLALKHELSID